MASEKVFGEGYGGTLIGLRKRKRQYQKIVPSRNPANRPVGQPVLMGEKEGIKRKIARAVRMAVRGKKYKPYEEDLPRVVRGRGYGI